MSNEIEVSESNSITPYLIMSNDKMFAQVMAIAEVMASSNITVPKHLQSNKGDCAAVVMQAMQWGMNPFVVAQKTHIVNGKLGYESQLVAAVIESCKAITNDGFDYEYIGDWSKVRKPNWTTQAEEGLGIRIWATKTGQSQPKTHELYLTQVVIRNSPLWKNKPDQQIYYLALSQWSRKHTPGAILGAYTRDELANEYDEKDITPPKNNSPYANKPLETEDNSDPIEQEYLRLEEIARKEGSKGYEAAWKALSPDMRKSIGSKRHQELKAIAQGSNVIDADFSEVNTETGEVSNSLEQQIAQEMQEAKTPDELSAASIRINELADQDAKDRLMELGTDKSAELFGAK